MDSELTTAICDLADVFDQNSVPYLLGGSFASSLHGIFRTTNDIDVLVEIEMLAGHPILSALEKSFIVDSEALVRNFAIKRSFNIFHSASAIKFDLFPSKLPFHRSELKRAIDVTLPSAPRAFKAATAEDIIIAKLMWNKTSASDRQIRDILGVMNASSKTLDWEYLWKWAELTDVQLQLKELKDQIF